MTKCFLNKTIFGILGKFKGLRLKLMHSHIVGARNKCFDKITELLSLYPSTKKINSKHLKETKI